MVTFPRAEITTVSIGLIKFDGLMLEDGTFGLNETRESPHPQRSGVGMDSVHSS